MGSPALQTKNWPMRWPVSHHRCGFVIADAAASCASRAARSCVGPMIPRTRSAGTTTGPPDDRPVRQSAVLHGRYTRAQVKSLPWSASAFRSGPAARRSRDRGATPQSGSRTLQPLFSPAGLRGVVSGLTRAGQAARRYRGPREWRRLEGATATPTPTRGGSALGERLISDPRPVRCSIQFIFFTTT